MLPFPKKVNCEQILKLSRCVLIDTKILLAINNFLGKCRNYFTFFYFVFCMYMIKAAALYFRTLMLNKYLTSLFFPADLAELRDYIAIYQLQKDETNSSKFCTFIKNKQYM